MTNRGKRTNAPKNAKAKWTRPAGRSCRAGSAEVGIGTNEDADPGISIDNS